MREDLKLICRKRIRGLGFRAEAAFTVIDLWRAGGTGFFKSVKMSPALTVPDASALGAKIYQSVQEAAAKMNN